MNLKNTLTTHGSEHRNILETRAHKHFDIHTLPFPKKNSQNGQALMAMKTSQKINTRIHDKKKCGHVT